MNKIQALKRIADELELSSCPLAKTATKPVPGEGNPDAELFFVGEAPGKHEDLTGRPFVGAAGKLLDTLLASIGIARNDVFITSIEKFRPPDNRDPKPAEIMACFPYLERQIAIIQPKIIVTLGRHARHRIEEWDRETAASRELGFAIFPMVHPAAVLYRRKLLPKLQADFIRLAEVLSSIPRV